MPDDDVINKVASLTKALDDAHNELDAASAKLSLMQHQLKVSRRAERMLEALHKAHNELNKVFGQVIKRGRPAWGGRVFSLTTSEEAHLHHLLGEPVV
jgi:glutamine synthetase type III